MRRARVLITAASLFAVTVWPMANGLAQPAEPPVGEAERGRLADEHFKRGKAWLLIYGKEKEAYEEYLAAWNLKQVYDIAGNLGNLELVLKKPRDAAEHLAFALRNHAAGIGDAQLEALNQELRAAKKQVFSLAVQVNEEGARVLVDGKEIGRTPVAAEVFVDPGAHEIRAELAGYASAKETVDARAGDSQTLHLTLQALPAPESTALSAPLAAPSSAPIAAPSASSPALSTPPPNVEPAARPVWPLAVGVPLAAVFLTSGIVFTAMANGKRGDATAQEAALDAAGKRCGAVPDAGACADLSSALLSKDHFQDAAVAGFVGAGIAALATPIVYLLFPRARSHPGASFDVTPIVGVERGSAGVRIGHAF